MAWASRIDAPMTDVFHRANYFLLGGVTLALFVLITEVGFRIGRLRSMPERAREGQVGPTLGGLVGLLGLLMAFTFGMAGSRFDLRRQLLVDQASAIKTAYLRADLLPEPQRGEVQDLLRRYVEVLVEATNPEKTDEALVVSQSSLDRLWSLGTAAAKESPTPITGLFLQSINDVTNIQAKRVTLAWHNPLPPVILSALYLVILLVLGVIGFEGGISGKHRPVASVVLGVTLAAVVLLIVDLDRPQEGLLRNSQQALTDLRAQMNRPGH
jgi:uncharacterized membrane protein YtjA (UPF0391 family)